MTNKLWFPLFIIGIYLLAISLPKTSPTKIDSVRNIKVSASPLAATPSASISYALVTKVVDGDTIDVQVNGKEDVIRLIGINTPEINACFGREAAIEARNILQSKSVMLETDPSQDNRDVYNRLLRYIFLPDGTNFGELMIKNGFAKEYTFKTVYKYQSLYKQAQKSAEDSKNGLWADNSCVKPRSDDNFEESGDR